MEVNSNKNIVFNYIKFILILGVVAAHSNVYADYDAPDAPLGLNIVEFFSDRLIKVCVPCFFILSGYLYFNNVTQFNKATYLSKTRRRIHTLLIPYLLWNVIGLTIDLLKYRYFNYPSFGVVENGHICLPRLIEGFWDYADGYPYAFAFWFIRNLIIFAILSPLAYFLGGKNVYLFGVLLLTLAALDISLWGFEFFILGCCIATFFKKRLSGIKCHTAILSAIIWFVIAAAGLWIDFGKAGCLMLNVASICAFIFLFWLFLHAAPHLENCTIGTVISSTFFIYAVHQFFCTITDDFYSGVFGLDSTLGGIAAFLSSFLTMLTVSMLVWLIMKKFMPGITGILSGGR